MTTAPLLFAHLRRCPLRNGDLVEYFGRLEGSTEFNTLYSFRRNGDAVELYTTGKLGDAHAAFVRELYWLNRRVFERACMPVYSCFDLVRQAS
jgi:hypothetical protein